MPLTPDELDTSHEDALRRIYQAVVARGAAGGGDEEFTLYYSGEGPQILHGGWDRSWAVPSTQTIDDLGELGLLRIASADGKSRTFSLSVAGRRNAEELIARLGQADYDKGSAAERDLAIDAFLARTGLELFTPEDLADAVPNPKFGTVSAIRCLQEIAGLGRVRLIDGGRWQVAEAGVNAPTYHVRVAPVTSRDLLSGPLYALDLSEDEVVKRFVARYEARAPIDFGDRTLDAYRKPKVTRFYGSGTEAVEAIRRRLAETRRVHVAHEAEEMFFKEFSEDVTDKYIGPDEPESVREGPTRGGPASADQQAPEAALDQQAPKEIFIVHGHQRRDEIARFIRRVTGIEPIILDEQAGRGRTIIEKFEEEARPVAYAVVLLTEDDLGKAKDDDQLRPRARQNAILELGYFIGKVGRQNVAVLHEEAVEILSDYQGVGYISFSDNWQTKLIRELVAAGFTVDPHGL